MTNIQKIVCVAVVCAIGFHTPTVFAQGPNVSPRMEKKSIMEELRERVGSRAGVAKKFIEFGRAAIGSGKVTAKTDTTITIEKDSRLYSVNITEKTQLRRRFWGKATYDEFAIGNEVTVIGKWTDESHTAIDAVLIRNLSIQKRFGVFFGNVKTLTQTGWSMGTANEKRPDQTVIVSSSTKFVNRKGETISQADIAVDHRIRVRGLWDRSQNTVTDVKEVKDFSIPIVTTPTPKP